MNRSTSLDGRTAIATKTKKQPLPLIEDPAEASTGRAACNDCGLYKAAQCSPFMRAFVPEKWSGAILVLAEAPGWDEDRLGRPMVGKAGQFLYEQLFGAVGIRPDDVAITNGNRCWPGKGNPTPSLSQVRLCRGFVAHDILTLRPKWVLAMGDNAVRSLYNSNEGVKRHRQRAYDASEFFGPDAAGIKVCATYHPASCFYQQGAEQKQRILEDLRWLVNFKGYVEDPEDKTPVIEDKVGLDIEWDGGHRLLTVGLAVGDKAVATEDRDTWTNWLDGLSVPGPEPLAVGHSIFGDLPVLRLNGLSLPSTWISGQKVRDSLLLARLDNENRGAYDLESTAVTVGIAPWKSTSESLVGSGKRRKDFGSLPSDVRVDRCRKDAWATASIEASISSRLNPVVVDFTHRLAACLKRMEMAGVHISQERYKKLGASILGFLEERREKCKTFAARYGMEGFEPSNDNHFRDLLYGRVGAKPERFTEKDKLPAVDHASLVLLYQSGSEEIKEAVLTRLRHEKADKLYATYIGRPEGHPDGSCGLASHLSPNSFVFQNINPLGARTGRRSSDNPNMQNWPKRLRAMATSRYPGGSIVKGDESQLEPRIMAYVAGIDEWQEIFQRGGNLYLHTAKKLWKKDVEKDVPGKPSPLYRITKATVLALNYLMEVDLFLEKMAVEQGIVLTRDQGLWLIKEYFGLYPQLPKFSAIQKEKLLRNQQVETLTGQIRHLPCPEGEKTRGFHHLLAQAVNFPIQGLAAFVTGSATLDLETAILGRVGITLAQHYDNLVRFWALEKLGVPLDSAEFHDIIYCLGREIDYPLLVNEVHDELVVDTPEKDVKWLPEMLESVMVECPTLRQLWPITRNLVLKADIQSSFSWGDA